MADTRPNIQLTAATQIDIYAALNAQGGFPAVTVGTKLFIQNLGSSTIRLSTKATEPLVTDGYAEAFPGNDVFSNEPGDSGAWAISLVINGLINVRTI